MPEVWTIWVRLSHAIIAIGVISLWCLVEFRHDTGELHRAIGYGITLVVMCRIAYGILARYLTARHQASRLCWPSWQDIRQHMEGLFNQQLTPHIGHNPLGQYAVYVMWGMMLSLAFTGWLSRTDAYWGEDGPVKSHAILSDGLLLMVMLHFMAVFWVGRLSRQRLIQQMVSGKMSLRSDNTEKIGEFR